MSATDTQHDDTDVIVLNDDEIRIAVENALAQADCTWEELQAQAAEGCFVSERARRTWFIVSTFEPSAA